MDGFFSLKSEIKLAKKKPRLEPKLKTNKAVIAMGLLSKPSLLLLDEPTTALDVTVEAGIVSLIADISKKFGTSQIYISHNLGLILETCDRVFVMYSGEVVEEGTVYISNPLFSSRVVRAGMISNASPTT